MAFRCRACGGGLQSRSNGTGAVPPMPCEKFAHITIAISRMSFEIDLRQDGHRRIAALSIETTAVTKQVQRIRNHLAPRAPPFHNQE